MRKFFREGKFFGNFPKNCILAVIFRGSDVKFAPFLHKRITLVQKCGESKNTNSSHTPPLIIKEKNGKR